MALLKRLCSLLLLAALADESQAQLDACGEAPLNTGNFSGLVAAPGSWPWMVQMLFNGNFKCEGSLINNQWVLTVSSCFTSQSATSNGDWVVYLGRLNASDNNPNEVFRNISRIITHPNYTKAANNIGLVQLSSPVSFTDYVQPVCLAPNSSAFDNSSYAWVSRWTLLLSALTLVQNQVSLKNNSCVIFFGNLPDRYICASQLLGNDILTLAIPGSPMVVKQGAVWVQTGIYMSGVNVLGSLESHLGLYTKVLWYQDWINSITTTPSPTSAAPSSTSSMASSTTPSSTSSMASSTTPSPASSMASSTTPPPVTSVPFEASATNPPSPYVCGQAPLNSGSGSGSDLAAEGAWPWQVSLQRGGVHICGGSLVSRSDVMSAADCFNSSQLNGSEWTVVLGRLRQNGSDPSQVSLGVSAVTLSNLTGANIALLRLAANVTLTDYIQPVCVDLSNGALSSASQCWVTGWGSGQGGAGQVLQQLPTTVVSCGNGLSSDSICTSSLNLQQGFVGSPLVCQRDGSWGQVAVAMMENINGTTISVSSRSRASSSSVEVFYRIYYFYRFITQNVANLPPPRSNSTSVAPSTVPGSSATVTPSTTSGTTSGANKSPSLALFLAVSSPGFRIQDVYLSHA